MLPLAHAPAWLVASLVLVAGVVYGSLALIGPDLPLPTHFDKLEHLVVYAGLALWFTGLVQSRHYWTVVLGLAALGLALEYLQFAMHRGRVGDPWDMAANLLGIAAGVTLAVTRTGGWAPKVEAWLSRN
jgi:VanZ family protein